MRDIKFRGVTPTGCWVKGSLIYHGEQPQIQYVTRRHPDDGRVLDTDWAYVDPKTVGQYTGLHDKNGKEIYEGDIVHCEWEYCQYKENTFPPEEETGVDVFNAEIIWSQDNLSFEIERHGKEMPVAFFSEPWKCEGDDVTSIEIIGNIHDNPEMLTAKTM